MENKNVFLDCKFCLIILLFIFSFIAMQQCAEAGGGPKTLGSDEEKDKATAFPSSVETNNEQDENSASISHTTWSIEACRSLLILLTLVIIVLALLFSLYFGRKRLKSIEDKIDSPIEKSPDKLSQHAPKDIEGKISSLEHSLFTNRQYWENILSQMIQLYNQNVDIKKQCDQLLNYYNKIDEKFHSLDGRFEKELMPVWQKIMTIDNDIEKAVKESLKSYYEPQKLEELHKHIGDRNLGNYLEKLEDKLKNNVSQETKIDEYENKYESLTEFIEGSNNKLNEIKREIDEFKTTNQRLLLEIEDKDKAIGTLADEKKSAQGRLNVLEKTIVTNEKEMAKIKTQLDQKGTEFETLKDELKIILPNYESDLSFFGSLFGNEWKQEILLSFLLLQSEAKNKSEGLRATFSRLDDAIYGTYSDNPARLTSVRSIIEEKINKEVLAGKYQIQWPLPEATLNEKIHSAETSSGNTIEIARTAIVKDANGVLITKSKVRTKV